MDGVARNDYILIREFPGGKGFADIVFIPGKNCSRPALVVGLKWNKSADGAIDQIKNKNITYTFLSFNEGLPYLPYYSIIITIVLMKS